MSTLLGASSRPEKTREPSTTAIAITPALSTASGAAPASRRPRVTVEPRISRVVATCPARVPWSAHARARRGAASTASHGRAPRAPHPSASAQPGGTSSSATHVRTSAVVGIAPIAPTTTPIDRRNTSAHAPVRKRRVQSGRPAAGNAIAAAWATVSTMLSGSNHIGGAHGARRGGRAARVGPALEQDRPPPARHREPPRPERRRGHGAAVEQERGERAGVGLGQRADAQRALVAVAALGDRDRHGRVAVERELVVGVGGHDQRRLRGASRIRRIRAGTPATTALSGTSRLTTAYVPTTVLSPTVTPRTKQAP